jgi:hypothetical protein
MKLSPALVALPLAFLPACTLTGRTSITTRTTVATPQFNPAVTATVAVPNEGVQVLQAQCQQGTQEACNGLDDNCNGVIDEGCGYSGGNIQITAAWQTSSDIDLHVFDPTGAEIYYAARASASGGRLDHDANAACRPEPPTVENVFWETPTPPSGTYQVRVMAYDMCGVPVTPTTLSISVGGRILGTYRVDMMQRGQQFTIPFTIP